MIINKKLLFILQVLLNKLRQDLIMIAKQKDRLFL